MERVRRGDYLQLICSYLGKGEAVVLPTLTYALIDNSFLNDKMKRSYKRIIEERKVRFVRKSE